MQYFLSYFLRRWHNNLPLLELDVEVLLLDKPGVDKLPLLARVLELDLKSAQSANRLIWITYLFFNVGNLPRISAATTAPACKSRAS